MKAEYQKSKKSTNKIFIGDTGCCLKNEKLKSLMIRSSVLVSKMNFLRDRETFINAEEQKRKALVSIHEINSYRL